MSAVCSLWHRPHTRRAPANALPVGRLPRPTIPPLAGVGLHTLRHSAASVMLTGGVPLTTVSEVLGHASIAITGDIYSHVAPHVAREALDRLSAALGA